MPSVVADTGPRNSGAALENSQDLGLACRVSPYVYRAFYCNGFCLFLYLDAGIRLIITGLAGLT